MYESCASMLVNIQPVHLYNCVFKDLCVYVNNHYGKLSYVHILFGLSMFPWQQVKGIKKYSMSGLRGQE